MIVNESKFRNLKEATTYELSDEMLAIKHDFDKGFNRINLSNSNDFYNKFWNNYDLTYKNGKTYINLQIYEDKILIDQLVAQENIRGGDIIDVVFNIMKQHHIKTIEIHNDWSGGFWKHLASKHSEFTWVF